MANALYSTSSILSGATNNTFTNSTFVVQSNQNAAFDRLQKAASASAFHSYVGRPQPGKCYPNTRVKLLKRLEKWAHGMEPPEETSDSDLEIDSGDKSALDYDTDSGDETPVVLDNLPIIWLKGGAGAGKSAVAQTFAERCEDLGHIVASFFFFSTDPTRNNPNSLVATLAYQIALADPRIRADMETVIHHDPRIFDKHFTKQFTSLIIDPLRKSMQIPAEENPRPCTVIIDGLDECTGGEVQAGIVRAISDSLRIDTPTAHSKLPRFLICSRPEEPIMRVFRSEDLTGIYTSIDLSTDTTANQNIKTFLEGKFAEIKQTHPHADRIPADWPSEDNIWTLQWNSSGHFIYADTVMKFISADVRPVIALESILGLRASPQRVREPFAELDMLYCHILSRALDKIDIDTIRLVFGFLNMDHSLEFYPNPDVLEQFLDLQEGELDALFNITASLVYLQCSEWHTSLNFYHQSCRDFLMEKSRAGQFYIEPDAVHMYAATQCHRMIIAASSLDKRTVDFMFQYNIQHAKVYDHIEGKLCHSLDGMTRRRELTAFFRQYYAPSLCSQMVVKSLVYCRLLINMLCNSEVSNDIQVRRAKGDMLIIIHDYFQSMVDRWSPPSEMSSFPLFADPRSPHSEMSALACLLCHPTNNYESLSPWGTGVLEFSFLCKHLLLSVIHSACPLQENISLMRELLEDEKMGAHRLTEEKYAEACLFWTMTLTKNADYFPLQPRLILQNQRGIIMNEAARRLRAPFQWRKSRQIINPYRTKGRSYYLSNQQSWFRGWDGYYGSDMLLTPTLTARELYFGSRPNLVRRIREQDNSTRHKPEQYIRREYYVGWSLSWNKKAITWHDQRRSVRSDSQRDRRVIRASRRSDGMLAQFYPFRWTPCEFFTNDHFYERQQMRVEVFALLLSCITTMLRKASKSDDLAALRLKAFAPFSQRFPKLMRRARQAMEEYAVRHGYPAIEGAFGPPIHVPANIQQDAVRITNSDVTSRTYFFIMRRRLKYGRLRLAALLGGLDEIYALGSDSGREGIKG